MQFQLPPLLPYPGDDAPAEALDAYIKRAWLLQEVERMVLSDTARARADLELARWRMDNIDLAHRGRDAMNFGTVFAGAIQLLADRTSATSSAGTTAKEIDDSVNDAMAVAAKVAAALQALAVAEQPAPAPAPAPEPAPAPSPPGEAPRLGISG